MPEKIPSLGYTLAGTVTIRRCGNGLMNYMKSTHRFYDRMIPIADALFDTYLNELKQEGEI